MNLYCLYQVVVLLADVCSIQIPLDLYMCQRNIFAREADFRKIWVLSLWNSLTFSNNLAWQILAQNILGETSLLLPSLHYFYFFCKNELFLYEVNLPFSNCFYVLFSASKNEKTQIPLKGLSNSFFNHCFIYKFSNLQFQHHAQRIFTCSKSAIKKILKKA